MSPGGRPKHVIWSLGFNRIKDPILDNKHNALCIVCHKILKNTSENRLKAHRNVCTFIVTQPLPSEPSAVQSIICSLDSQDCLSKTRKTLQKVEKNKNHYTKSRQKKLKLGQTANSGGRYVCALLPTAGASTDTQSSLDNDVLSDQEELVENQELHSNTSQLDGLEYSPCLNSINMCKLEVESFSVNRNNSIPASPPSAPDRSFFESILPFVSEFTGDQKIEFRCEILNIIKRMRNTPTVQ